MGGWAFDVSLGYIAKVCLKKERMEEVEEEEKEKELMKVEEGKRMGKQAGGDKNVLRRNWQSVDRKQWGYRSKGTKRQVLDEQVLRSNGQQYSQWFNSISLSMGHRLHSKIQDS